MLILQLKSGGYLTIGEQIAVQVFQDGGDKIRVAVKAPKDLTILRDEVRERVGSGRPDGLIGPPSRHEPNRFQTADEPVEINLRAKPYRNPKYTDMEQSGA